MKLGIDASNIRAGGTVTHLVELLRAAEPGMHGFDQVVVWAGSAVLRQIEARPWLKKVAEPMLEQHHDPFRDRRHLIRACWQRYRLRKLAKAESCDVLFVPGGTDSSGFTPVVTMSQNMLPFDVRETRRYGLSLARLRLLILKWVQCRTFRRAAGVIFLTNYARIEICRIAAIDPSKTKVVPHGIGKFFFFRPRHQRAPGEYSFAEPFRVLYVSSIDLYKHQWHVARAVAGLRAIGIPLTLELVGPSLGIGGTLLGDALSELDPDGTILKYLGQVPYAQQAEIYQRADLCVFASSCENLPIILLEGMASGLPIACSNRGSMPEVLGTAGLYFDPEQPDEIATAIRCLFESPDLRKEKAEMSYERAQSFSWERCANETFAFLALYAKR